VSLPPKLGDWEGGRPLLATSNQNNQNKIKINHTNLPQTELYTTRSYIASIENDSIDVNVRLKKLR
jgi:hypothetical protein